MEVKEYHSLREIIWLMLLVAIVYYQVHDFEFVQYDDPAYIYENSYVKKGLSSDGIKWAFTCQDDKQTLKYSGVENIYHPLTWLSHMLDVQIFGMKSGLHHISNVLLHCIGGIYCFLFVRKFTKSANVAFIASALFLIHPTHVESVGWVSERKDVLSGVFFWSALYYAISKGRYAGHLAYTCLVLGLLSKPSIVVLPLIVILIRIYTSDKSFTSKNFLQATLKYKYWLLTAIVFSLITFYLQRTGSHQQFADQSSIMSRVPSIVLGYWFYLYRSIIPLDLSFSYPLPAFGQRLVTFSCIALFGLFYLVWALRHRAPALFFGVVWFTLCWLPISGIIYIGVDFTVDRYLYFSLGGFFIILAQYLERSYLRRMLAFAVITIFSILSYQQVKVWENTESLFINATKSQPESYMGWTNLGAYYQTQYQIEDAINSHKKSIQLNPRAHISEYNLSRCYLYKKNYVLAAEHLEKSFKIAPYYKPTLKLLETLRIRVDK